MKLRLKNRDKKNFSKDFDLFILIYIIMDVREEKEKLKALNLLNCMIEVDICGTKIRG